MLWNSIYIKMNCIKEAIDLNEESILNKVRKRLSPKRLSHTLQVQKEAVKMAERYKCNIKQASVAAILHDMCRDYSLYELNQYVKKYNLDNIYLNNKSLAHAKVAAKLMGDEYNILDQEIINAVSYHTTGKENMTLLEKIIYLADVIEPNRHFDGVDEIRVLAYRNINQACLASLDLSIRFIIEKKEYLHIDTLKARNYLLINKKGGKDGHQRQCYKSCEPY